MRNYVRKTNRGNTPQKLMQAAAYAVLHEGQTLRTVAKAVNICHASLFRFIKKLKSGDNPTVGYKPRLLFSASQEHEIVKQLAKYAKVYSGLSMDEVRRLSCQLAKRWKYVIPEAWVKNNTASKEWAEKFVKRHSFPLKPVKGKAMKNFYNMLHDLLQKHNFLPSRIYYLEEITVPIAKYISDPDSTDVKPVSMELAVNALGDIVTPKFMMNNEDYKLKDRTNICIESKTEILNTRDLRYFDHFIDCTKPSADSPILLLIDNCQYIDVNVLKKAAQNSVILLCVPKCEVAMKPLLKLAKFIKRPKKQELLSKAECDILDIVRTMLPSRKEVVKCFHDNGVWPFNPTVVTGEEFVPETVAECNYIMGRKKNAVKKMGNHTEDEMRTALNLIKSGSSIRQASILCGLSFATVRRYVAEMKKNDGQPIRLTPNYEVNKIFTTEEEEHLVKYIKKGAENFKGLTVEGYSPRDCRRLAYEIARIINKKIPQSWVKAKMAGVDWFRSFRTRNELLFEKRKAGDIIRETVFDVDDMEKFFGHLKIVKRETVNEAPAQPLPGPSSIPATQISGTNTLPRQDAPSGTIDQCRFCAAFTKCAPISDKPYLSNSTTLAFNDISVKLDFNDETLPKTVCQTCDKKLKAMHDFVNLVKSAQGALINIETRPVNVEVEQGEDFETLIVKTECDDDDESKDGIIDSVTVEETVFIKDVPTKRKNSTDSTKTAKVKKAKVTEEENELTINIKEEVIERDANDENTECSLSDVGRSISNTGSVADTGCPVSNIECSSDTMTDVKPSEVELATSALVFEMRSDGSGFGYS
ncbi:uncharacterized protein LOC125238588 [Leguminivora glycinivorella]|uniref:uncharacterized protein LOC125238588 n=1 Tax=Leguminivora glycinivorella TaxID=1035111 RepID=UPI00200E8907|nr:uncharacterized protein LOC125238588 [Leguminivora glycinivorella]